MLPDRLKLYRAAGLRVEDRRVPGRPGRIWAPLGVMEHHTVSNAGSGDIPSLNTVLYGRADVSGPLCNELLGRSGLIVLITDGSANHSGGGSSAALDRFMRCATPELPPFDSDNHRHISDITLGREIENNGTGEPYPAAQLDALLRADDVLYEAFGIACVNRVIGHKEWTRRKIDPSFDMPAYRERLRIAVQKPPVPPAPPPTGDIMPDQADRIIAEIRKTEEDLKAAMFVAAVNTAGQVAELSTGPVLLVQHPKDTVWAIGNGVRLNLGGWTTKELSNFKEKLGTNFDSRVLTDKEWNALKVLYPTEK